MRRNARPHIWASRTSKRTYLDLKFFVNLHDLAENGDVLHEACELPGVTDVLEQASLLSRLLFGGRNGLGAGALSRSHCGGTEAVKAGRVKGGSAKGW